VKQRFLLLLAGGVTIWLLVAWPVYALAGESGLLHSGVAAALCLALVAATFLWSELTVGGTPEEQLTAVFGGMGIRMAGVLIVAFALHQTVPALHEDAFLIWIVVFYLVTLALEIILIVRRQATLDAPSAKHPDKRIESPT
jgi:hypothetical protein